MSKSKRLGLQFISVGFVLASLGFVLVAPKESFHWATLAWVTSLCAGWSIFGFLVGSDHEHR